MEKLKELLGEDLFSQVKEKLGDVKIMIDDGNFVPKARFDQVNEEKKDLKNQLAERDNQLSELQEKVKDNEELSQKITELQDQNKATAEEYENKLQAQQFDFAVEKALTKTGAKNVKAVKALLDLEKVKLDGENLIGLQDQVEALQENEPYLFGEELSGRSPNPSNQPPPPAENPWSQEHWNITEQMKLLKEDPEKAEQLKSAAQ